MGSRRAYLNRTSFRRRHAEIAVRLFECLFPADESGPGAAEIDVVRYVDRALAGPYADHRDTYRDGLDRLDRAAHAAFGKGFADCSDEELRESVGLLEVGELPGWEPGDQQRFFELARKHCLEGLFSDPIYGGNRDKSGWRVLGHPGVWLDNSAEENLSDKSVDKNGKIQSLEDIGQLLGSSTMPDEPTAGAAFDRDTQPSFRESDVVIVGMGGVGGLAASWFTRAGLRVVGIEAGPFWTPSDFAPDELRSTYYCRGDYGGKFAAEAPVWRKRKGEPVTEATYSLGRMMNGVGGSVIHYGAWLRRYHPQHFRWRSHILERWGEQVLPEGCSVADWPLTYDELEPHYTRVEQTVGVAGDERNPFVRRSQPLPLPPMRPFRMGETFREATESMGLHPHMVPVGQNTEAFDGRPEMSYTAWNNGFGSWRGDKWHPGLSSVQEALGSGYLDLRTHCRVTRVVTNSNGRAIGVEYVDRNGQPHVHHAAAVILAAYTYENVRLLLLSADATRPDGLGNTSGQLGRHYMTKQFAHVNGDFPDTVFNRHTGPASQAVVVDDFLSEQFDAYREGGFVGGATLGGENQFLPIQIALETLPPGVPRWGNAYKDHIREWQHFGVVRIQNDAMPYTFHTIDLDPVRRDRSGLGLPVVRLTYDLQENEHRQAAYFESTCEEILRRMGAARTWTGPRFTGVCSSHDLGGCRMAGDPANGVLDRHLAVHDTPGLYVYSGAAMPTCPGINPTLTIWAICSLAADHLIDQLGGERRV